MNSNLEIEYKMLVNEQQLKKLAAKHPNYRSVRQLNVYYDSLSTPLKSRGMGMRIRDFKDQHCFTLKKKVEQGHQEYEVLTNSNDLEALSSKAIQTIFKQLGISGPFAEIGRLLTWRTEIPCIHGMLCLDINEYYGIKDYEIEYELKEKANPELALKEFTTILQEADLSYIRNKHSKIQRCLKAKEEMNQ